MATRLFKLFCAICNAYILIYRKEGSGGLLRIYLDKILEPKQNSDMKVIIDKDTFPSLLCPKCSHLIGIPILHGTKKRPAFRLIKSAFRRKEKK